MLLWFVAGIVIGWLIELFIDWNFWRRNVYTSAPTDVATLNELATLRRKVKEYEARIQKLESQTGRKGVAAESKSNTESKSKKE